MKRLFLFLSALVFLTACQQDVSVQANDLKPLNANVLDTPPISNQKPQPRKPDLTALNEGDGDYDVDIGRVVDFINQDLERPTVSADDIQRGWYYGTSDDKKFGTPDSWQWIDDGAKSRWARMGIVAEFLAVENDQLCRQTAGTYVFSCLDRDVDYCEYILESECRCIGQTDWVEDQGCILKEKNDFVAVSLKELEAGFYLGLPNQKKLNTPADWEWEDLGRESRWFKPLPDEPLPEEADDDITN